MLFPKLQRIKRNLLDTLRGITVESGAQYTPTVREMSDLYEPQGDVEITLDPLGIQYTPDDESPIGHTSVDLNYQINVLCSRSITSDTNTIDEICMMVCGDVEAAIMADVTRDGNAEWTRLESAVPIGSEMDGYYAWILTFSCRAVYSIDDPQNS